MEGAVDRVRPKLMTVATTLIGLLPIMFGAGTGAAVMKRIAAPMVGGLVSSTLLTLVILPAAYYLLKRPALAKITVPANKELIDRDNLTDETEIKSHPKHNGENK